MSSVIPLIKAENADIVKSLTPTQRRVWHKLSRWVGDDYIPAEYLATAWGRDATSFIGWRINLHVVIHNMNKRLHPHGIRIVGRSWQGGWRVVRIETEAA